MEEQDIIQYKWQWMKHQIQKSGSPSCIVMGKKTEQKHYFIISFLALSTIDLTPHQTKIRVHPFMDTMQSNPATYMSPSCPVSGPQFYVISHPTCTEGHQFNSKPFFGGNSFLPFLSAELLYLFIIFLVTISSVWPYAMNVDWLLYWQLFLHVQLSPVMIADTCQSSAPLFFHWTILQDTWILPTEANLLMQSGQSILFQPRTIVPH